MQHHCAAFDERILVHLDEPSKSITNAELNVDGEVVIVRGLFFVGREPITWS